MLDSCLESKIYKEELSLLSDDLKRPGEKHDTDNDEDDSHGDLNVSHGLVVFPQNGRHPADAEGGEKEWDGKSG
jgi:hypothetical protein